MDLDSGLASPVGPVIFLDNANGFLPKSLNCKGLNQISLKYSFFGKALPRQKIFGYKGEGRGEGKSLGAERYDLKALSFRL
jgi:hypothetical protein